MQDLEQIFHEAVKLGPEERAAFVARLHASDPALGQEVESLLAAHEKEDSLLDSPAYEAAAELLLNPEPELQTGHVVARYQVLGPIGKGGMGEVYLAKDLSLDRKVALKFLRARLTGNSDRLRRFIQEAKATSALNHPNIITIHEVGHDGDAHFIAMEFIDGLTLRNRLARTRMNLSEALDVAIQAAGALAAAHSAGIIHRDIKPENVMLRADGYVKVLDFGLAKLAENAPLSRPPAAGSEVGTLAQAGTEPGTVMGTVNYMSPEQARGRNVDVRTDIFSLGLVIYEMVAGRLPFVGETSLDVLVSILEKEPAPLASYVKGVPPELQRIVGKSLCKDREQRYQSARDLVIDLKNLKEELAFAAKVERSKLPGESVRDHRPTAPNGIAATGLEPGAATVEQAGRLTLSVKKRTSVIAVGALTTLLGLATAAVLFWPRAGSTPPPPAPLVAAPERKVTYWITVQKYRNGSAYEAPFRLRDDINFEKDYRIRLTVSSPQRGRLYLLNEGAAGGPAATFNLLFPSATTDEAAAELKDGQEIQIPKQSWFQFDAEQGSEKIWMVWADKSVPELESAKRFANDKDRGEIKSADVNAQIRAFLNTHSSPAPAVERDADKKETAVKAAGDILVHAIKLEHH